MTGSATYEIIIEISAIRICIKLCLQHGGLCTVSHINTQLISAYFML